MKQFALILALLFFAVIAHADNTANYNLVNLDVSSSAKVDNDTLTTLIRVQYDGENTARLTDHVNRDANKVIEAAKHYVGVSVQTSGYYTRPIYKDGKIESWQVSQQLTLTSEHFSQVSELLADINGLGMIQSMQFSVSAKRQEQIKQKLLQQAIDKFKAKAKLIAKQFGLADYKLVNLSVGRSNLGPVPVMQRNLMMAEAARAKSVAPKLEAGTNDVSVHLSGTVQLLADK